MRKLIVSNAMSLDGYYAGPDDNVMVLELDPAFDAYNAERLRAAGTLLLGRRSFEGFKSFWPSLADDPDPGGPPRNVRYPGSTTPSTSWSCRTA
jgi:dihydrofolate reductase